MSAYFKNVIVYVLAVCLVTVLVAASTGCSKAAAPAVSSPAGSATAPAATQQRGGAGSARPQVPSATPSPAPSSPAATIPPVTTSPPPGIPTPSPVSTAVPVLSPVPPPASIAGAPLILITAPLDASTVPAGDVTISDIVSNFNLVDQSGQANAPGQGHIIYYMDVTPQTLQSQTATTQTGTYAESTATSYTWHNVQAGPHYFSVQLVNNDSTPFFPAIKVTVYVIIQGTTQPGPAPLSTAKPAPAS